MISINKTSTTTQTTDGSTDSSDDTSPVLTWYQNYFAWLTHLWSYYSSASTTTDPSPQQQANEMLFYQNAWLKLFPAYNQLNPSQTGAPLPLTPDFENYLYENEQQTELQSQQAADQAEQQAQQELTTSVENAAARSTLNTQVQTHNTLLSGYQYDLSVLNADTTLQSYSAQLGYGMDLYSPRFYARWATPSMGKDTANAYIQKYSFAVSNNGGTTSQMDQLYQIKQYLTTQVAQETATVQTLQSQLDALPST